jgi:hypothetical protein
VRRALASILLMLSRQGQLMNHSRRNSWMHTKVHQRIEVWELVKNNREEVKMMGASLLSEAMVESLSPHLLLVHTTAMANKLNCLKTPIPTTTRRTSILKEKRQHHHSTANKISLKKKHLNSSNRLFLNRRITKISKTCRMALVGLNLELTKVLATRTRKTF